MFWGFGYADGVRWRKILRSKYWRSERTDEKDEYFRDANIKMDVWNDKKGYSMKLVCKRKSKIAQVIKKRAICYHGIAILRR